MLVEKRRADGEIVETIECDKYSCYVFPFGGYLIKVGNLNNKFCIFDATKDVVKRTEKCPSVGDDTRCYALWEEV